MTLKTGFNIPQSVIENIKSYRPLIRKRLINLFTIGKKMGAKEDAVRKNGSVPSVDEQRIQK